MQRAGPGTQPQKGVDAGRWRGNQVLGHSSLLPQTPMHTLVSAFLLSCCDYCYFPLVSVTSMRTWTTALKKVNFKKMSISGAMDCNRLQ